MQEFGAAITYTGWPADDYNVMASIQNELRRSMHTAMELEVALGSLHYQHPGRARRWRKAQEAHALWLSQIYPPVGPECCETCGQPLPDYDDD